VAVAGKVGRAGGGLQPLAGSAESRGSGVMSNLNAPVPDTFRTLDLMGGPAVEFNGVIGDTHTRGGSRRGQVQD
jgi:hypothetical protein